MTPAEAADNEDRRVDDEPAWRQRAVSRSLNAARSRAEQRVQRYLDAAFELIDEKGTTEFTIQEVIDRSKQSLRGFYQYFDGKDELLLALFEETHRRVGRRPAQGRRRPRPIRSRDCARSRSASTSGASPPTPRKRGSHNRRPISEFSMQLAVDASRAGDGGDGADLRACCASCSRTRSRPTRSSSPTTPAHRRRSIQQTVMYSWFGNRLIQRSPHAGHGRGDLGVLPARPRAVGAERVLSSGGTVPLL